MCVQNLGLFAIFHSFVLGNRAGDKPSIFGHGGGINMWKIEEKILEDLVVMDNLAVPGERGEGSGGGLNVQDDGDDGDFLGGGVNELKSCTFRGNTAPTGGGINFGEAGTSPTLTDTVVCGNAIGQIEGSFTDGGGNTIAEECPGDTCPADLTGDGQVDGADLTVVLGDWGLAESPADLNDDGLVDGADLTIVLAAWGPCS
jgi:hypothetical protein